MPVSRQISTRETTDLHADWWSPKRTVDGTLHTPEVGPEDEGRYVERVVVYAQRLYIDDQWVQTKSLGEFDIKKKSFDSAQAAKALRFLLQRMIVEITDERGVAQPKTYQGDNGVLLYSGAFIEGMDTRDTTWIQEQLDAMKEPPVRVVESDLVVAEKRAERHHQLTVVQGFPDEHPLVVNTSVHHPEDVALARFPGDL